MRAQLTFLLTLVFITSIANTKTAKLATQPTSEKQVQLASIGESDYFDEQAANEIVAFTAKGTRKIATDQNYDESSLTPAFKAIRDKFLSAKAPEDLDTQLADLEAKYNALSDDAKFFAAQMIMMKPLRGIVWRLRPLFEKKSGTFAIFSGNPATHSAVVSALRLVYHATEIYVPTQQADALFKFAVAPSKEMRLAQQFKTVSQYQTFLMDELYPELSKAAKRIKTLFKPTTKLPFVWDNQMMYGAASFQDGIQRYVGFNEAELALTQAAILRSMHGIYSFCAYNQDELINVAGQLGKVYGIDGYRSQHELGVTSSERTTVLNSFRSKGFLDLKNADYMGKAYTALRTSVKYTVKAQEILQNQPARNGAILNPLFFKSDAQPRLASGTAALWTTVNQLAPVRNLLTGEVVVVNLPAFYSEPPASLLDLLPIGWQKPESHEINILNTAGETLKYRDYSEGSPTRWEVSRWNKLFPELKPGASISDAFRTIQYSGGPALVLGGLTSFIF